MTSKARIDQSKHSNQQNCLAPKMASAEDDSEENNEKMETLFSTEKDKILLPIYQVRKRYSFLFIKFPCVLRSTGFAAT